MKRSLLAACAALIPAGLWAAGPEYNTDGEMLLPKGYETWVFVGSNLGLGYVEEPAPAGGPLFHNVYMETEAYLSFMETGEFPDPTQFVFEVYGAGDKEAGGELTEGQFNEGPLMSVEAAIKDSNRPVFPDSKEMWAYYFFSADDEGTPDSAARAFPDSACWSCHDRHAGYDNVWVQFYPRLKARLGL
ncbi:MAG: cytochrome P460 family protein [Rhodobacter sp.]|nr:cytochrome P460 family protein [Rhodobacter sp.]